MCGTYHYLKMTLIYDLLRIVRYVTTILENLLLFEEHRGKRSERTVYLFRACMRVFLW